VTQPSQSLKLPSRWRLADQPLSIQFWVSGGIVGLFSLASLALLFMRAHQQNQLQPIFIAIVLLNIAFLLVFSIALIKLYLNIARPISNLSRGISRYQAGNFKTRVPVSNRSQIGFLEASFNEMAEKIENMVTDLKKLDELKTEFLSTVSHELRTPLTSISGYTKLLISGDAGQINEMQKEFLYIVDTNIVRLTNLINDLLDVEKMELGKVQFAREREDLTLVLKECCDTFDVLAKQKGLELRYNVPSNPLTMIGDRDRLIQIFMNLLSNAIKYTKNGFIEIAAEQRDYAIIVRIRDSGVGLTSEDLEKMFQKFYRARSGVATGEGGTGLGLVIVRGLMEGHGGSIKVESTPGEGTCFQVIFPAAPEALAIEGIIIQEDSPASTKEVWLIDDDKNEITTIEKLITDAVAHFHGFKLTTRTFKNVSDIPPRNSLTYDPAVIIVDPKATSTNKQAVSLLRKKLPANIPIMVVSAEISAKSAFSSGATGWLRKPLDRKTFLNSLKDMIGSTGYRILIADSNADLRLLLKRALEQRGFTVDDVDRGSVVLNRLAQTTYDLVAIDMHLADISTLELLRIVRTTDNMAKLPVFLMSLDDNNTPSPEELTIWGETQFIAKYRGLGSIVNSFCQYLEEKKLRIQNGNTTG
jgi:signal transduction histidine kinase/CheY-like chemotaxis protein